MQCERKSTITNFSFGNVERRGGKFTRCFCPRTRTIGADGANEMPHNYPFFFYICRSFLMENQKKKLRLEDIKVESFVTSDQEISRTILGGMTLWHAFTCFGTCDMGPGGTCRGCEASNGEVCNGLSDRCGTNVPNCTGFPVCASNTACPDATCADGSWCCPPDSMNQTCGAFTCNSGCPGC
jgi:hypothetical protein